MTEKESNPNSRGRGVFLGRLFGIQFFLDYSWFLIAALLVGGLAMHVFPAWVPGLSGALYFAMSVVAAALFFTSILLHELGHSVVSQRCGIPVPRITLLFIGGIAEISREPDTARAELKIALGGPLVTLALIVLYAGIAFGLHALSLAPAAVIFHWLAVVNTVLLVFNAIPGYPLDGGRVLRAMIWERTRNLRKATFITTRIGIMFSWFLIGLGIFSVFSGALNGIVLLIIGIFLKGAADAGYMQALHGEILAGERVRDIMTASPVCIPAHTPLNLAVEDFFLADHHISYPVCDGDGGFRGMLRIEHLRAIDREKWPYTNAGDAAATAGSDDLMVDVAASAKSAMTQLMQPGRGHLAVIEDGRVAGIISRSDILNFIRIHTELEE